MKSKLLIVTIALVFVFQALFVLAEDPTKPVLEEGDVVRFIKTWPLLQEDFKKLGAKYEARSGAITIPEALRANETFLSVLKKHGWDERFIEKMTTIVLCYSAIMYKKEINKANPQLEKSIKEIDSNPNLSDAMKEQLKKQLLAVIGGMESQNHMWGKRINKIDLELVRPLVKEIKEVLEKNQK